MRDRPCLNCGAPAVGLYCPACVDVARTPREGKRRAGQEVAKETALLRGEAGAKPSNGATSEVAMCGQVVARTPKARRGLANYTETRFRETVLAGMLSTGEVVRVEFEPFTFHIHGVGKYTPDWVATLPDNRLWCWEVKGPQRMNDGAVVRMKAHAAARPWIRFTLVQRKDGGWRTLHDLNAPAPLPMDYEPAREG